MSFCRLANFFGCATFRPVNPCKELLQIHAWKASSSTINGLNVTWQTTQTRNYWRNKKPRAPYTKIRKFDDGVDLDDHVVKVDLSEPRPGYEEELADADDVVKKIFSLEYSTTKDAMEKMLEDVVAEIQDHPYDVRSLEVEIAKNTVLIRNQIKHCTKFQHDKYSIGSLRTRLEMRKEALGKLLMADSEKFDWLTKKLKLKFEMPCEYYPSVKLTKREERRRVAQDAATALVKLKTEGLEEKLKEERARFNKFKEQELNKIEAELKELGIKMDNLPDTLIALGREDLVPKQIGIPTADELIWEKKLQLLMKKKEEADDKIYRAHNFLTPREMPSLPDKYFF